MVENTEFYNLTLDESSPKSKYNPEKCKFKGKHYESKGGKIYYKIRKLNGCVFKFTNCNKRSSCVCGTPEYYSEKLDGNVAKKCKSRETKESSSELNDSVSRKSKVNEFITRKSNKCCSKHLSLTNKTCRFVGCIVSNFEFKHDGYCIYHKSNGKIENKCKFKSCNTRPSFGNEGGIREYCKKHKLDYQVNLKSKCKFKGCNKKPSFGLKNGKEYCKSHKLPKHIDLNKKCKFEGCNRISNSDSNFSAENYCDNHRPENKSNNLKRKRIYSNEYEPKSKRLRRN